MENKNKKKTKGAPGRPVNIKIKSVQSAYRPVGEDGETDEKPETVEIFTDGLVNDDGELFTVSYDETELTGMEGARTVVSFSKTNRGLVSVTREGSFSTALVFEEGKRHICAYDTPYMPIEVCVVTRSLSNTVCEKGGQLSIDYSVETGGMKNERTSLSIKVCPRS